MRITLSLLLITALMNQLQLHIFFAEISSQMQLVCLSIFSNPIEGRSLLQAFACGKPLSDSHLRDPWIHAGLYHLLVVSGGHLIFLCICLEYLEKKISLFKRLFWFHGLILIGFTLFTGFQPPLVRALAGRGLESVSKHLKLNWSSPQIIAYSGACCLIFFPHWIQSYSLILSWSASAALTLAGGDWAKSTAVFCCLIPVLWGWGHLHPSTILINVLLAEVTACLLAVTTVFYFLSPQICEALLKILSLLLRHLAEFSSPSLRFAERSERLHLFWIWTFLVFITAVSHGLRIRQRRKNWRLDS